MVSKRQDDKIVIINLTSLFSSEALAEKNRNSDNKNNENATKCWQIEPFHILEPCSKCDSFAKSSLKACKLTGYRETLNCEKYGPVSRR